MHWKFVFAEANEGGRDETEEEVEEEMGRGLKKVVCAEGDFVEKAAEQTIPVLFSTPTTTKSDPAQSVAAR